MKFEMQRVHYMPRELRPSILYVSEEFDIALHLCACGCGAKVKTPLGPTGWTVIETKDGPSLRPSVGNWQHSCQSHYWIDRGQIRWAEKWSTAEITEGRRNEEDRRRAYYDALNRKHLGFLQRLWHWLTSPFGR